MKTVSKLIITTLTLFYAATGLAQDSPHSFSGNVNLASDYLFRGQSQTDNSFTIQGGIDYGHEMGFYAGTWASNIRFYR